MKAAVIYNFGETPHYEDFEDPIPGKDETLIQVKAVVLENFDKMIVSGGDSDERDHYIPAQVFATVNLTTLK